MLKFSLFLSGVLSFWFFIHPGSFSTLDKAGEVLGVSSLNKEVNRQTVYEGLLSYCLDKGKLPGDLNELFQSELSDQVKIDLNSYYKLRISDSKSCEFDLETT